MNKNGRLNFRDSSADGRSSVPLSLQERYRKKIVGSQIKSRAVEVRL